MINRNAGGDVGGDAGGNIDSETYIIKKLCNFKRLQFLNCINQNLKFINSQSTQHFLPSNASTQDIDSNCLILRYDWIQKCREYVKKLKSNSV